MNPSVVYLRILQCRISISAIQLFRYIHWLLGKKDYTVPVAFFVFCMNSSYC
jgi:hypothetical protein